MAQTFLERLLAVNAGRHAVGIDLLKPRSAVRDPPEEEMIKPDKLPADVPPLGVALLEHGHRELTHRGVHPHRHVTARGITVQEVAIFMGQHRPERIEPEASDDLLPQDERPLGPIASFRQPAAALEDRQLRAGRQIDDVDRPGSNLGGDLACQFPEPGAPTRSRSLRDLPD